MARLGPAERPRERRVHVDGGTLRMLFVQTPVDEDLAADLAARFSRTPGIEAGVPNFGLRPVVLGDPGFCSITGGLGG